MRGHGLKEETGRGRAMSRRRREATVVRIVWSLGVGTLVLALLVSPWLRDPGAPPPAEPPPVEPSQKGAPTPAPLAVAPSPTAHPVRPTSPEPARPVATSPRSQRAPVPGTAATPWPLSSSARRKLPEQRQRLVRALRADYPTPLARRDAVLAELEASGESRAAWTERARTALETWRTIIGAEVLPVRAEPPHCYAAGCVTRVTFPDEASYDEARQRVPGLKLGDVGPHMQLPAERLSSGEVSVSWAVLSPERP